MIVYTRSYNQELFNMMKEFIPEGIEIRQMKGYNSWEDALRFIQDVIKDCQGWAVIMDEDMFTYDFAKIQGIIDFMSCNGFTHAGMSDRGVSPHRTCQPTTINPFFNILNCPELRNRGALELPDLCPVGRHVRTMEIFDELYLQMWKVGKTLFLKAATTSDGITTHLQDHLGNYFALHSWLSREWTHGERSRILEVYKTAKEYGSQ